MTTPVRIDRPDDGIPVLTDLVPPDAVSVASPTNDPHLDITQRLYTLTPPAAAATTTAAPTTPASGITATGAAPADQEWLDALSLRVQSRVLAGLTKRIDPEVEQRLRESLTDLLDQVLASMTAELKVTVRDIVRDAVAQSVAAELADMHKSNG